MSLESTTRIMNGYFEALLGGKDFGEFFTDDVSWTMMETGDQVRGREAVRDLIVELHTKAFDAHPELKRSAVTDGFAFVEADFVGTHTGVFADIPPTGVAIRVPYCVAYDVVDDGIQALRGYMPIILMRQQLHEGMDSAKTVSR
jgi:predicted ester cyclase